MMHVALTTAALALVTLGIIILRCLWSRLPRRLRIALVYASMAMILLRAAFVITQWSTTSDRLNGLLSWAAIAGYELIIVLFTLYRPKWLTTISATILIVPLFASSILLPLAALFDSSEADIKPIDNHFLLEKTPWDTDPGNQNTGVDLLVYYRSSFAPFLRRRVQRASFNNDQCDSSASFATIESDRKKVHFHCPTWPSQQNASSIDLVLPIK